MERVGYGHSLVGGGSVKPASCFAAFTDLDPGNRGLGGSTSATTAALVQADSSPTPALYLLLTGLIDLRLGGKSQRGLVKYTAALRTILDALRRAADALVVALVQPHLLGFSLHAPYNLGLPN